MYAIRSYYENNFLSLRRNLKKEDMKWFVFLTMLATGLFFSCASKQKESGGSKLSVGNWRGVLKAEAAEIPFFRITSYNVCHTKLLRNSFFHLINDHFRVFVTRVVRGEYDFIAEFTGNFCSYNFV